MKIRVPSILASGAHQLGEESELILFCLMRAVDAEGCGRVIESEVTREATKLWSNRHVHRLLQGEPGTRYWEPDRHFVRLQSERRIILSYECEVLQSSYCKEFDTELLTTRARRGAALLAAVLAGHQMPRSRQFIDRYAGVDRGTVTRWMDDDVITTYLLVRHEEWAER